MYGIDTNLEHRVYTSPQRIKFIHGTGKIGQLVLMFSCDIFSVCLKC